MKRSFSLVAGLCLLLAACDEGTPVAPSDAVLILSANPATIAIGGESVVTIVAQRGNGQPVNPGTQIFLSTDLGTVPATVETDETGRAEATLTAGDRTGTANVVALSGTATAEVAVAIVGDALGALELTASSTSIPGTGGSVTLRALARNEDGAPLPGIAVTFATEVGSVDSGGSVVVTGSDGVATDRLRVSASTAEDLAGTTFQARARAIEEGTTTTAEVEIRIE